MKDDIVHASLSQVLCVVLVCCEEDVRRCLYVDGVEHLLLAQSLETIDAKAISRLKQLHRSLYGDRDLVRVEVLEEEDEGRVLHILDSDRTRSTPDTITQRAMTVSCYYLLSIYSPVSML